METYTDRDRGDPPKYEKGDSVKLSEKKYEPTDLVQNSTINYMATSKLQKLSQKQQCVLIFL
jgi:hypothetical protein